MNNKDDLKNKYYKFYDLHIAAIFWILFLISIFIVLIFIDHKKWFSHLIGNNLLNIEQLNPILTLIYIYVELVLWSLLIVIIRNKKKVQNIQKEKNWNSIELLSISDDSNYYILGDSGIGKSIGVIKTLLENNEVFFYYDCTYDNFLSKAIINNGKVEKIIFWAVKKSILLIYKNIIIDDIHLLKSNELFQVSEWLEFYNQKLFIISPKNFRFNNEYNHTDYYSVSNIIDKLYSKFTLIDYEVFRVPNRYSLWLGEFLETIFGLYFDVSFRVEMTLRTKTNSNMYRRFYDEIKLLLESLKQEHKRNYQDMVNEQIINFFEINESYLEKQVKYMKRIKMKYDNSNELDNDTLILMFMYFYINTNSEYSNGTDIAYQCLIYYIFHWGHDEMFDWFEKPNWYKETKIFRESMENIMNGYKLERSKDAEKDIFSSDDY